MPNYQSMPSRQLVSQADQSQIENANVPRSKFINTWSRKTAFDGGKLVPFLVDECLPGDHMSYNITAYLRMATPTFPLFDNVRVDTHIFFVPCRLLWDNWEKFMGAQDNPGDSIAFTIPTVTTATVVGDIYDHFGIPTIGQVASNPIVNSLPFRAYNKIFNDWFRDENLVASRPVNKASNGPDSNADYSIQNRAKSHDYFTSALPWPQKFTAPTVPVGGLAPITGLGFSPQPGAATAGPINITETLGNIASYAGYVDKATAGANLVAQAITGPNVRPNIYADLSVATGLAINTFRQGFLIQQLLERDARGGTRYVEKIRAHFGVISPDYRLDRAEYIGGGQTPLNITPIAQTAPTGTAPNVTPVGALGGAATAAGTHRASYAATEHGYIIGLISVRTELSYQQGLHKLWSRRTQYDFYFPSLAGLGEQAILTKEIYYLQTPAADDVVFGYQERWQEYRTRYSDVTGIMRSTAAGTIDQWHLAQRFNPAPTLNSAFIADTPPMSRVLAAGTNANGQQYLADILYQRTAVRPIPTFGTPAILGRF